MPRNDDFFSYYKSVPVVQKYLRLRGFRSHLRYTQSTLSIFMWIIFTCCISFSLFHNHITVSICAISRRLRYDHVWVVILYYDSSDKSRFTFFFLSLITHIWRYNGYMSYLFGLSWWSIKFYFRNNVRSLMTSVGELAIYKMGNVKKNWNPFNYGVLMIRCVTFLKM